ncbi:MAG: PAS domain S-box protein [Candidatus Thorarchaeota archaeon]
MSRDIAASEPTDTIFPEQETLSKEMLEAIPLGISISALDGTIIEANSQLIAMFGYDSKAHFLKVPTNAHWDDPAEIKRFLGLSKSGMVRNFDALLKRKDGSVFWGCISATIQKIGNKLRLISSFQDITKQKYVLEILRESEKKYRGMAERTLDPIAAMTAEGKFLYLSPAVEKLFELRPEEMIGQNIGAFIPKSELPKMKEALAEVMNGRNLYNLDLLIIQEGKPAAWCLLSLAPMIEIEGTEPVGIQVTFRDITERKLAAEKLKRQKEELSEFAHAMNHDLRNYFIAIKGYADLLLARHEPMYAERIGKMVEEADNLLQRSVSLADAGLVVESTVEVDLSHLIQRVAEVSLPEKTSFEQENVQQVVGDKEKLKQVFKNLLENATTHGKATKIVIRQYDAADGKYLDIINNGAPIPPQNRPQIFRRGFSTKKGGGLGLAIVKKLVEAHGWQIYLTDDSETTFRIIIP